MRNKNITRTSVISLCNGYLSFQCTSSLYGVTDAGGTAVSALKMGFVPLGDGCDYVLTINDKRQIRRLIARQG